MHGSFKSYSLNPTDLLDTDYYVACHLRRMNISRVPPSFPLFLYTLLVRDLDNATMLGVGAGCVTIWLLGDDPWVARSTRWMYGRRRCTTQQWLAEEHAKECAKGVDEIELDERKWMEQQSNDPLWELFLLYEDTRIYIYIYICHIAYACLNSLFWSRKSFLLVLVFVKGGRCTYTIPVWCAIFSFDEYNITQKLKFEFLKSEENSFYHGLGRLENFRPLAAGLIECTEVLV